MEVCRQSIIMICNKIRLSFCFISCHLCFGRNVWLGALSSPIFSVSVRCREEAGRGWKEHTFIHVFVVLQLVGLRRGQMKQKEEKRDFSRGHPGILLRMVSNLKPLTKILLCSCYILPQCRVLQADAKSTLSSPVDGLQPIAQLDSVISCIHNTVE